MKLINQEFRECPRKTKRKRGVFNAFYIDYNLRWFTGKESSSFDRGAADRRLRKENTPLNSKVMRFIRTSS